MKKKAIYCFIAYMHSENSNSCSDCELKSGVFCAFETNSGYYWLSSFVRISRLLLTQSTDHWRYEQTERRKVKNRTLILSSSNYVCHKSFIFRYFFRSSSDFSVLGSSLLDFFGFAMRLFAYDDDFLLLRCVWLRTRKKTTSLRLHAAAVVVICFCVIILRIFFGSLSLSFSVFFSSSRNAFNLSPGT